MAMVETRPGAANEHGGSFVAQGHAVYAGTCGFVVRLNKKPPVRAKRRVALRYMLTTTRVWVGEIIF